MTRLFLFGCAIYCHFCGDGAMDEVAAAVFLTGFLVINALRGRHA
jgi:hypothetical protein